MKFKSPYFAAVDLGSNSFHMVIARVQRRRVEIIDREKEMIQLAKGIGANGHLSMEAQKRAIACLRRFGERLRDIPNGPALLTGLRRIAEVHDGEFRLTANQNVIIANVRPENRDAIERLVAEHGLTRHATALRRNAMACVALPTCGLALAESERYLPDLVGALEERLAKHGLAEDEIVIRMTGCPNGCARPPTAEVGIYGYGKNDHVILVGGSRECSRIAHVLYSRISQERVPEALVGLFRAVRERNPEGLPAGEFLHRADPATLRGWIGIEDGA